MQLLGFELTSKTPNHIRLFSLPTHQIQHPAQWPHASNFEAVVTPLASLLDVPPQCSKEESENSQSWAVGSVVRSVILWTFPPMARVPITIVTKSQEGCFQVMSLKLHVCKWDNLCYVSDVVRSLTLCEVSNPNHGYEWKIWTELLCLIPK